MSDVFISYAPDDVGLASALASGLGRIGKPWWRQRSMRVFRDANVIAASSEASGAVPRQLEASSWFVAVISPAAAASPRVVGEVEWWAEHRGSDRLLVVLADGTCPWDLEHNEWAVDATAVPAPLRGVFDGEPRWVDARWTRINHSSSAAMAD